MRTALTEHRREERMLLEEGVFHGVRREGEGGGGGGTNEVYACTREKRRR